MTTEQQPRIDELEQRVIQAGYLAERIKQALEHMLSAAAKGDVKKAYERHDQALDAYEALHEFVEGAGHYFDGMQPPYESVHPGVEASAKPQKVAALTSDEVQNLLLALGRGQPRGFSDKDAQALVDWAKEIRINAAILDLVLRHRINACIGPDGEVKFSGSGVQS